MPASSYPGTAGLLALRQYWSHAKGENSADRYDYDFEAWHSLRLDFVIIPRYDLPQP